MDAYNPEQVMIGTHGQIWINDKLYAQVTACKAVVKLTKEKVQQVKKMFVGYKYTGYEGSGTIKANHVSSFWVNLMADNMHQAKATKATIVMLLDDPDAIGQERVTIRDATFDTLTLMDWSAGKLVEESVDFTFTEFEILDATQD